MPRRSSRRRWSPAARSRSRDGRRPPPRSAPSWSSSLTQFGATVAARGRRSPSTAGPGLAAGGSLSGVTMDLSDAGELAPAIVALAALASGPSRITGIGHLRGHETNRLAALTAEINALGGSVTELDDGLDIQPARCTGGLWHTYEDHRMATAGAIIGLAVPGHRDRRHRDDGKDPAAVLRAVVRSAAAAHRGDDRPVEPPVADELADRLRRRGRGQVRRL